MNKYNNISPSRAGVLVDSLPAINFEGKIVVEYGAAKGNTLLELRNRFSSNIVGFDLHSYADDAISVKKFDLETGDFSQHRSILSSADLILFLDVLEHIRDPKNTLIELSEFLKPGAKLVIISPNFSSLRMLKAWILGYLPETESGYFDASHYKWLSPKWFKYAEIKCLQPDEIFYMYSKKPMKKLFQSLWPHRLCSQSGCVLTKR